MTQVIETQEQIPVKVYKDPAVIADGLLDYIAGQASREAGLLSVTPGELAGSYAVALTAKSQFEPTGFLRAKWRFDLDEPTPYGASAVAETGTMWVLPTTRGLKIGQRLAATLAWTLGEQNIAPLAVCSSERSLSVFTNAGYQVLGKMGDKKTERTVAFYPGDAVAVRSPRDRAMADAKLVTQLNSIPRFKDLRPLAYVS